MIAQELEVILHQAFVGAREVRHEYITVEHLLLALLSSPTIAPVLRACGADTTALRESLTGHVNKAPQAPANREVETQPTLAFQRVIQRAILKVQSSGGKQVGSVDVLLAIFAEQKSHAAEILKQHAVTYQAVLGSSDGASAASPDVAAPAPDVGTSMGGGISRELEVILHAAFFDARQRRHEIITVEHLLLALLGDPSSAGVLSACGADLEALRADLGAQVAKTPLVPPDREVDTRPTHGFQAVLQRAILKVQATGREVSGQDLLVALFGEKDSHAVRVLERHGVGRLDVVSYVAHGVVGKPAPKDLGDATEVQVVLHNDDHTPMEFVVRLLQEFFGMDAEDAKETMLEVHRHGAAVCGLYAREDGQALVEQVLAFARDNGHPLMCEAVVPK
jgi:ATP-dependent Clp protease ATP-binding subunit ClpA